MPPPKYPEWDQRELVKELACTSQSNYMFSLNSGLLSHFELTVHRATFKLKGEIFIPSSFFDA